MTNSALPWDRIDKPQSDFNVLLIAAGRQVPVYWARDTAGRCLYLVELRGDHSEQFRKNNTSVRGIDISLRQVSPSLQQLVLAVDRQVDLDLFHGLCSTLTSSLEPVEDPAAGLAVALQHIKRWKLFLAGRVAGILTQAEVRGLYAELTILRHVIDAQGEIEGLAAWCGPDRTQQDFVFDDTAVEVKGISGQERNSVRISSEDQLESMTGRLFLTVVRLATGSDSGTSLNELVASIEHRLSEPVAVDEFVRMLASYGYVPMNEYDSPKINVLETRFFLVEKNFPKLVRSKLPQGIARVSYDIEIEALFPFECDRSSIFRE
jgi:putative PD-(D/E)XK family protein DUF4420